MHDDIILIIPFDVYMMSTIELRDVKMAHDNEWYD